MLKTLYQVSLWASIMIFGENPTSVRWRRNEVFRDEKRVIAPHGLSQINYNFDFMERSPCSRANTFIVLA